MSVASGRLRHGRTTRAALRRSAQTLCTTRSTISRSSGKQEPQFVPARSVRPISATLVALLAAMASRIAASRTPKQAQIKGPASATASARRPANTMRRDRAGFEQRTRHLPLWWPVRRTDEEAAVEAAGAEKAEALYPARLVAIGGEFRVFG